MSVQALSCAFAVRGLSSSEKLVLLALANYAGPTMSCFPSQDRIAEDTELSSRTVWAALKSLEERGIVTRQSRKRADGTRATDVFTLHFGQADPVANPAKPTRKVCEDQSQSLHEPVATVATLTTFEPATKEPVVVVVSANEGDANDWPEGSHFELLVTLSESPRLDPSKSQKLVLTAGMIAAWRRAGASWARDVVPVVTTISRQRGPPISTWKYFENAVLQSVADNRRALAIPEATHDRPDHYQRKTPRDDRLGRMLAGAMAAADE